MNSEQLHVCSGHAMPCTKAWELVISSYLHGIGCLEYALPCTEARSQVTSSLWRLRSRSSPSEGLCNAGGGRLRSAPGKRGRGARSGLSSMDADLPDLTDLQPA